MLFFPFYYRCRKNISSITATGLCSARREQEKLQLDSQNRHAGTAWYYHLSPEKGLRAGDNSSQHERSGSGQRHSLRVACPRISRHLRCAARPAVQPRATRRPLRPFEPCIEPILRKRLQEQERIVRGW